MAYYGDEKYYEGNWYEHADARVGQLYIGGVMRHLSAIQGPNASYALENFAAVDKESGLPEIDHMIMGLLMLRGLLTKQRILPEDPGPGNSLKKRKRRRNVQR